MRASCPSVERPQPTRTLGRNSWIGGLAGSTGAAGDRSTRQRRSARGPSSLTSGGGTLPVVSMVSFRCFGVMTVNSLRQ
jgi:hypothetical protein